jgi:hypothetical protein
MYLLKRRIILCLILLGNVCAYSSSSICPAGSFLSGGDGNCELCPANAYKPTQMEMYCSWCRAGKYSEFETGSTACIDCGAGKSRYASWYDQPTGCFDCTSGKFSESGAQSCGNCPEGKYASADNTRCIWCPAGTYASSGLTICHDCPVGKYRANESSSCTLCPTGKYNAQPGSSDCALCLHGEYSSTDKTTCLQCPSGKISNGQQVECCDTQDYRIPMNTTCVCKRGLMDTEHGCRCAAGTYMANTSTGECVPAPKNTYVETANNGDYALKLCPYNTYTTTTHNINQTNCLCNNPQICEICPLGKYYTKEVSHNGVNERYMCHLCEPGKFAQYPGLSACESCPRGFFTTYGASECQPCPRNTYGYKDNDCLRCPSGKYSGEGSDWCYACKAGTYHNGHSCVQCVHGAFTEFNGETGCTVCAAVID